MPWELIFGNPAGNIKETRPKEKYYKSAAGRRKLLQIRPKN
jgi:hypothetical protein